MSRGSGGADGATTGTADTRSRVLALVSALLLGAGGLAVGAAIAEVVVAVLTAAGVEPSLSLALVVSLVSVQGVGCIVVSLLYLRSRPLVSDALAERFDWAGVRERLRVGVSVPSLVELAIVVASWIATFVAVLVVGGVLQFVLEALLDEEQPAANQTVEIGLEQPELLLLLIPASFLLIGPGEELLFRGVVQGRLREAFGPATAVVVASVFFAAVHFPALVGGSAVGNVVRLSVLVIPALVLGATYEYTDNLVVPVLIHALYNATIFGLLYVVVTSIDDLEELQGAGAALVGLA